MLVKHAAQKGLSAQAYKANKLLCGKISLASISIIISLTLKILKACQKKGNRKPSSSQIIHRDSHIHSISARISTPTSFPMVCGLENTNVHVS